MTARAPTHGPRVQQQPDGTVRQSQMVSMFGPGAMVDLLTDAVLVGGLDFWSYDRNFAAPYIQEQRLRDSIVERFRVLGRELSKENPFRAPPVGNDREPSKFAGVQVLEFPHWFVCQKCRALQRKDGLELKNRHYWHQCERTTKAECVPVRFVSACKRGHVDEFHWIGFAHAGQQKETGGDRCSAPSLTFEEGKTGDFNEIRIACACGASNRAQHHRRPRAPVLRRTAVAGTRGQRARLPRAHPASGPDGEQLVFPPGGQRPVDPGPLGRSARQGPERMGRGQVRH